MNGANGTLSHAGKLPAVATELFVGGSWRPAADGARLEVRDPATEEVLTTVAAAGPADVDAAVAAARAQVDGGEYARLGAAERRRLLLALADLVERDRELLALLEALDVGRPIGEPRQVDIPQAVDTLRHFASLAEQAERGEVVPVPDHLGRPRFAYTLRQPLGVVGAIVPWNAPTMISAWKLAPALASGCAIVLKPSEEAPLAPLHLARLVEEAGFPAGAVSVLPGDGSAGAALVRHPGLDKLSFTGSTEVGREIAVEAGRAFRPVGLELGGKSAQIVLADADLEAAAAAIAAGLFANQGQICASGSRVLVAREVEEELVERLVAIAAAIRLGDPLDPATEMGSLINAAQLQRVLGYVAAGSGEGAVLRQGGERQGSQGHFVAPTLLAGASNQMRIAREEIFGPVGTVIGFGEPRQAVALANDSIYGLAAFVWTRDLAAAHGLARQLRAGTVWVNGFGTPDPRLPWGGLKESGIGKELGRAGLEAHSFEKAVSMVL